jgi:hypothetical protein
MQTPCGNWAGSMKAAAASPRTQRKLGSGTRRQRNAMPRHDWVNTHKRDRTFRRYSLKAAATPDSGRYRFDPVNSSFVEWRGGCRRSPSSARLRRTLARPGRRAGFTFEVVCVKFSKFGHGGPWWGGHLVHAAATPDAAVVPQSKIQVGPVIAGTNPALATVTSEADNRPEMVSI